LSRRRAAWWRGDVVGIESTQVLGSLENLAKRPALKHRGQIDDGARRRRDPQTVDDEGIESVKAFIGEGTHQPPGRDDWGVVHAYRVQVATR
jgi:hypothetical protein